MNSFEEEIIKYKEEIDKNLRKYLNIRYPEKLWESMSYTTLLDGKRIRPVICLEACRIFCSDIERAIPTACAAEMLHAQSLIHDDLPSMDNDDLRRGKPSNHKVFGEATAILAGDALLSYAPQVIIDNTPESVSSDVVLKILKKFFLTAGAFGLVGGQMVDIDSEHKIIDEKTLNYIHANKTGALFEFVIYSGALLGGANSEELEIMLEYAKQTGLAFQIADDLLDVLSSTKELGKTANKDAEVEKSTYVTMFGKEQAFKKLAEVTKNPCNILEENKIKSDMLIKLSQSIYERVEKKYDGNR